MTELAEPSRKINKQKQLYEIYSIDLYSSANNDFITNNEHQSIKSMYFINKTHFLYFDITDIILDVIKIILWKDI